MNFDVDTVSYEEKNINEYLSKEFEIINETILLNIELIKFIGIGTFGKV